MDLTRALLRAAAGRPHLLVIAAPGTDRLRARVEQDAVRRGWPPAYAPADTDLVVVVGQPGKELGAVIDDVWAGVPAPRTLLRITGEGDVAAALDGAVRRLADADAQRAAAPRSRPTSTQPSDASVGEQGHDGGGHHDHGGGMELPGGLAMADLGEDRDGLALDQLHVTLGPVLPEWPSGLVVDVVLQGDVIQEARSRFLDHEDHPGRTRDRLPGAARALDGAARVLALAGWTAPAVRCRDLRDTVLLEEDDTDRVVDAIDALLRRVRRSRTLRWMLRSAGAGRSEVLEALDGKLLAARAAVIDGDTEPPTSDLAALDARLVGAEFAAARLIVAAADPSPQPATAQPSDRGGAS